MIDATLQSVKNGVNNSKEVQSNKFSQTENDSSSILDLAKSGRCMIF
ncbi:MAG: hypothetical protein LBP22_14730 [Deltaproteobacteria bacterium]|nr:hypothetical protein [Deltaproteobacteria bacterium]